MSLKGSDRFNHHLLHDNSTYAICQMRSMIYAMSKHAFTFQQQPAGCLKHGLHGMPRCLVTQVPGVFAQQGLPADIQQRERREHGGAVVSGALARHQSRVLEGVGQARRGQVRTMVDLMMVVLMCFELRVRYRVESPSGDVFRDGFDTFAVRLWDSVMACGPENKPFVEF